jgi:hypothetical protein
VSLFKIGVSATRNQIAAPVRHFQREALVPVEQHPTVGGDARESLQIRNDDDRAACRRFGIA